MLVDLDAFFASVEQLDHPEWRGKPVIVGGSPQKRGVVSTASYEARAFGVHSAMASSQAQKLCPQAIWTQGNFHRYRELSNAVMEILFRESPHVMQVSIDEAFVDVSPTRINQTHPVVVAKRIQAAVDELGVSCSIGVGVSKVVAKIASDLEKPHGLTVVQPNSERAFLAPLPVKVMSGIGPVAQNTLHSFGVHTLNDVVHADELVLRKVFGKNASLMRNRALGIDSPVQDEREPAKSVSNEVSLAKSVSERSDIEALIATMAHKVGRRLRAKNIEGNTLVLKIRFEDLHIRTVQRKIAGLGTNELSWIPLLNAMLDEVWTHGELVRLVGVGVSGFDNQPVQMPLFGLHDFDTEHANAHKNARDGLTDKDAQHKEESLLDASDAIAKRFGEDALRFGHEIRTYQQTTGSSPKDPTDYK